MMKSLVFQRTSQKEEDLVEEPKSFILRPKEETGNYPSFRKKGPVASNSSRKVQREAQRTSEETERSQDKLRQGERQSQFAQTLLIMVQNSQIRAFSHGNCTPHGQSSYGFHIQGTRKDELDLYTQIIDEI
ncbi:hypothetical protein O181_013618 [Austropuccinia psidii MF-1]|uniref:Uncharacterized protein n=1 Tax=Austropuccinia psidii MF-1 TaxID=1389203 RepID=A0A9Q3GNA1_9BASI|nr:hypothetical protein [Austropuccinia psidii MF-1]